MIRAEALRVAGRLVRVGVEEHDHCHVLRELRPVRNVDAERDEAGVVVRDRDRRDVGARRILSDRVLEGLRIYRGSGGRRERAGRGGGERDHQGSDRENDPGAGGRSHDCASG